MTIAKINLDSEKLLEFDIAVSGGDISQTTASFVIEGPDYHVRFPGEKDGKHVRVAIPTLDNVVPSGVWPCVLEILVEGDKYFEGMRDTVELIQKVTAEAVQTETSEAEEPIEVSVTVPRINDAEGSTSVKDLKSSLKWDRKSKVEEIRRTTKGCRVVTSKDGNEHVFGVTCEAKDIDDLISLVPKAERKKLREQYDSHGTIVYKRQV